MNLQQVTELLPPVVIQIADLIGFPPLNAYFQRSVVQPFRSEKVFAL